MSTPARALLACLVVAGACSSPAYAAERAAGFDAEQLLAFIDTAKTLIGWIGATVAFVGVAILGTLWRMNGTLSQVTAELGGVKGDQAQLRDEFVRHVDKNDDSHRRMHRRIDQVTVVHRG
jgi:hypothetical protein